MFTRLLLSVFALSLVPPAFAQAYPTRPIKVVVGYSPGGTSDFVARLVAAGLGEQLKQNVIVENHSGAGGTIGANLVARAAPDGYTIYCGSSNEFTLVQYVMNNVPYDPLVDLTPVVMAAAAPTIIVVNPSVPARDMRQLLALAKSKNGLPYGSPGLGSNANIGFEVFHITAKVPFIHVPYKGGSPAAKALVAGEVPVDVGSAVSLINYVRAGKAKPLAIMQDKRSGLMPDVPTLKEATGVDGMDGTTLYGFWAPAKTPKEIVARLEGAMVRALADPIVRERLTKATMEVLALPSAASAARLREMSQGNKDAIERTGLKLKIN